MLKFVEDKCKQSGNHMTVVVESTIMGELTDFNAREQVLIFARRSGFPARGLNGLPQTYPVNERGETSEELLTGHQPVTGYRADYQVNAGAGVL